MASVYSNDSPEVITPETIACKILKFYHRSRKWATYAQDPTKRNQKFSLEFIHAAQSILRDIDSWDSQIPLDWRCAEPDVVRLALSQDHDTAASSRVAASFLSLIRACEVCFYSSAIGIFTMVDSGMNVEGDGTDLLSDIVQKMQLRVQAVIKNICGNVHRVLESNDEPGVLQQGHAAGAYHVLWPLWAVINCPFASVDQVDKCRETLGQIGSTLGFNLAFLLQEASFPLGLQK
ncbi:hypothetical protein N7512_009109 [Penicillium capsulatum]|nr:hypothetical protein N7512_009109 [Penicillium capsulatum]